MPFTAAHPAAVLALIRAPRLRLDATCLVIGSMAPDFEYFFRGRLESTFSHTVTGALLFDLPATLLLSLAFHALVKWPALLVLPERIAKRVVAIALERRRTKPSLALIASLVASALLGTATH